MSTYPRTPRVEPLMVRRASRTAAAVIAQYIQDLSGSWTSAPDPAPEPERLPS